MKKNIYFFDDPKKTKAVVIGYIASCVILLIIDLFIHKHGHFSWEDKPGFFAIFGFLSCVILALIVRYGLRKLLKRKEGYYD